MDVNPSSMDEVLGANIRACRKERELTAADLDDRLRELGSSMTPRVLQSIETGQRAARVTELLALAAALRIHPVRLLLPHFVTTPEVDVDGIRLDAAKVGLWLTETGSGVEVSEMLDPGEPTFEELAYLSVPARYEKDLRRDLERCYELECSERPFARLSPDGTIVGWSWASERLFGWKATEIVGRSIATVQATEGGEDRVRTMIGAAATSGQSVFFTDELLCKNGDTEYVRVGIRPAHDLEGDLRGFLGIAVPATRPVEVEGFMSAVSKSEAVVGVSARGSIQFWGGAAEDLYGWTAEEAVGKPFTLITGDVPDPEYLKRVDRLLSEGRIAFKSTRPTKSGRKIAVQIEMTAISNADGEIIGIMHVSRRLTVEVDE